MFDIILFPIGATVVFGVYLLLRKRAHKESPPSAQRSNTEHAASVSIIQLTTTNNDRPSMGDVFSVLDGIPRKKG